MLETIREFATEKFEERADAPGLRAAHATWYIELAERARPELRAHEARAWLERLDAEHANLRVALDHLLESGNSAGALRLSGAIWLYWQTRGDWTEGRRYLAAAVACGADLDPELLVNSLHGAAILALWQGDVDEGERLASRILEISHTSAHQEQVYLIAIHLLAIVASWQGDRDQARALLEESLEIGRRGGDQWLLSVALNNLGDLLMGEGDYGRAVEFFEESLAVGEARGDLDRRARANGNLGWATLGLGDSDQARDFFRRSLEAATEIGLVECQLWAIRGLAAVDAESGDIRTAARLCGHATELASRLGAGHEDSDIIESGRQTLATLEAALSPELLAAELAAGAALSLDDAIDLAIGTTSDDGT
jgi:non-specific serine/threonine protein kinase